MPKGSFLSQFANDIFISYTHIDNKSFGEEQKRWVNDLHALLGVRVEQWLGHGVQVWMDPKLQGNDEFADALRETLARVGVLVCVVSPRYLTSKWCLEELQGFLRASAQNIGTHLGTKSRVFKVLKTPVPRQDEPEPLRGLLGYFFYHEPEPGRVREFHLDPSPEGRKAYWARLDDLARDIADLLKQVEAVGGRKIDLDVAPPGATIYLAESSSDLRTVRDEIKRDLMERGHRILPERSVPQNAAEAMAAMQADLEGSALSIHPLGARYGVRPEGDDRSIPHMQFDIARTRAARNGFAQLIWVPRGLQPAEDRQARFIADLQASPGLGGNIELLVASLEEVKTHVIDKLKPATSVPLRPEPPPGLSVYLICHPQDFQAIQPVQDALNAEGFGVLLTARDGTEAEIQALHRDSLINCDAVIIFYGRAGEAWLRVKLLDLVKAPGWGRARPLLAHAVYVAAPSTPAKQAYHDNEAMVLQAGEAFDRASLAPFTARLKALETSSKRGTT